MSWGSHAEVIEPESLKQEILSESELMVKKYARSVNEDVETSVTV